MHFRTMIGSKNCQTKYTSLWYMFQLRWIFLLLQVTKYFSAQKGVSYRKEFKLKIMDYFYSVLFFFNYTFKKYCMENNKFTIVPDHCEFSYKIVRKKDN
jgi:hypothetical protein